MPKGRVRRRKSVRRAVAIGAPGKIPASEAALLLPPALADPAQPPPEAIVVPATLDSPHIAKVKALPKNSVIRQKALAIMAMRLAGHDNEDIARELELSERSLNQYMWMAGKNGWIPRKRGLVDPKDELEFSLAHKVIRNLDDAMDDDTRNTKTGMPVKTEVALEVAKGTLFKRFGEQNSAIVQTAVLAVKIEMAPGTPTQVREGTTGGVGRWIEADVVDAV